MKKIDRELSETLYQRSISDIVEKLLNTVDSLDSNIEFLRYRIERIVHEAFGSGYWNEHDFYIALYGAVYTRGAFEDFKHSVVMKVPEIHNYFQARHGIDNYVGKWVQTKKSHESMSCKIPAGSICKITEMSDRGYDICCENGDFVSEIGWEV